MSHKKLDTGDEKPLNCRQWLAELSGFLVSIINPYYLNDTMTLPKQSPPVKRPHFVQTHECVDIIHGRGQDLLSIRMDLMHGANYNDPARFNYPGYARLKMSSFGRFSY